MSYQAIATTGNASHETHLGKVPKLKRGDDEKIAAELEIYIDAAEGGLRSILVAGYFLECIAEELPKNQLGPWVEAHCKRKWRTVQRWKQIAAGLADAVGIKYKKRIGMKLHEVLALPLGKVPEDMKSVRAKLDDEIAGKSYRQLFLELTQIDEDSADLKKKKGRRKGEGGATKEQREAAALREERERLEEMQIKAGEVAEWLLECSDVKNFGKLDELPGGDKSLKKLSEAVSYANNFLAQLKKSK